MNKNRIDYTALGRRIRKRRKENKLTQGMLAELVGISLSFLGHIERGSRKASVETIVLIATALGVTSHDLLCDSMPITASEAPHTRDSVIRIIDSYLRFPGGLRLVGSDFSDIFEEPLSSILIIAFQYGVQCGQEGLRLEELLDN